MLIFGKIRLIKNVLSYMPCRYNKTICLSKTTANMESAYFRYTQGDENYELSFLFNDSTLNYKRQFNFVRQSNETVGTLLHRINTNIEKAMGKKKKKVKGKKPKLDNEAKKEEEEEIPKTDINIKLLQDGISVSNDAVVTEIIQNSNIELSVLDTKYQVSLNGPWVINITLPTSILSGFPLYPLKFNGLYLNKDKCSFHWYSGKFKGNLQHVDWAEVGSGFVYYTKTTDIGNRIKIKCIPKNDTMTGPEVETISTIDVEAGPGLCPFENRQLFTSNRLTNNEIRIVSYNILADLYCDSDFTRTELFPYCPPYALNIDYRKQLFIKEITGYNGDIVCLQEVDSKIFTHDLLPVLSAVSYDGHFIRKGGEVTEGLACFYRNDRFRFIEEKSCILSEILTDPIFQDIWSLIQNNEPFVERLKSRTTSVHSVVLESLDNQNEIVVVGNTHLYFKPDADHIRVMQGGLTIIWLNNIMNEIKQKMPDKRVSLILCGDFNSVPSCGVYKLYTTGHVPSDFIDWRSS